MPTFPVTLTDFLAPLRAEQQVFDLSEGMLVQNATAGGEVYTSGGMTRLWHGTLTLGRRPHGQGRALQAKLHALRGPGASFYIRDLAHDGIGFAAQINGVNGAGDLSLKAVPSGARVRAGDYIGFAYEGRRALHMAVEDRQPDGSGVTSVFSVVPPIEPGWAAGAAVSVGAAVCRAVMVPGKMTIGHSAGVRHEGVSFDWIQTLRAI